MVVDTLGLILALTVHAANVQDRNGAKQVLQKLAEGFPRLQWIWADGGYTGKLVDWVQGTLSCVLQIVKRPNVSNFVVLPKRWIVERTFGWLNRYRRLSKDYEQNPASSEAMVHLAMINLMLHRLSPG